MSCRLTEKNVTFIHIPKTGGKSVRKFLENNHDFVRKTIYDKEELAKLSPVDWNKVKHPTYAQIKGIYKLDNLGYVFTCIRNPYHRALSGYFHMIHMKIIKHCSFVKFIKNRIHYDGFMQPMVNYFENDNVNRILRYENLQEDFQYVKQDLKVKGNLPIIGRSFNNNNIYNDIYNDNPELMNLVYDAYEEDFIRFKYKRDSI